MSATETTGSRGFSRRTFIKGAAALTAGGMLAGCSANTTELVEAQPDSSQAGKEEIFTGTCRGFCTGGCLLNCHVRDGVLVRTSAADFPNTDYNRICLKGLTQPHRVYSADRLQYPMRRVGERGKGEFERISWDEAINEIAEKWKAIIDESGHQAIAIYDDTGNNGSLCRGTSGSIYARFKKAFGITTLDGVFDKASRFSLTRMTGVDAMTTVNEMTDWKNCKTMLVWSAHPAVAQIQSSHFISEARDAGTRVIYIDPVYSQSAILANEWVPIRAGSDGALAMGMMNVILENGWENVEFLKAHSNAPCFVKESDGKLLRLSDFGRAEAGTDADELVVMSADGTFGTREEISDPVLEAANVDANGIAVTSVYSLLLERIAEYPVDRVVDLTGIPEDKIRDLAKAYALDTPASIYCVFGADHYYNGHWSFSCMTALAILTGNLGRSGSFIGTYPIATNNLINAADALDVEALGPTNTVAIPRMTEVMTEHTHNGQPFTIRSLYVAAANPMVNTCNRQTLLEWIDMLDFIVVADMRMTDTCKWADIVLPACHWFECVDVYSQSLFHPYAILSEKSIEPAFESKSDFNIVKMLAAAMGREEDFSMTEEEYMEMLYTSEGFKKVGLTYEALKRDKAVKFVKEDVHIAFNDAKFKTKSGLAEFYIEDPKASNVYKEGWDLSKEHLPYWEPPREAWKGSELQKKYPLQLISEKSKFRTHSQWGEAEVIREINPEPFVDVSVADAAEYGIKTGDAVRLFNDRGYVVVKAYVVPNLPAGVLRIPKGWSEDEYIDGNYPDLVSDEMNGFCANIPFFDVVVGMEKA